MQVNLDDPRRRSTSGRHAEWIIHTRPDGIMKRCFYSTSMAVLVTFFLATSAFAQDTVTPDTEVETEKRAQTGLKFLSTSVDARATAIGGAVTAQLEGSSVSMFYNPASMAGMQSNFHASFGDLQFITDIRYNAVSAAYRPSGGNYGVIGVSVTNVDYGEFIGTVRANNAQGFIETGEYSPTALAVGVGYARSFTDRFAAGAHIKYAFQNLGEEFVTSQDLDGQSGTTFDPDLVTDSQDYSIGTVAVDFGVVYHTGFRSLVIAMSARNFSQELIYVRERFELPLTFQLGTSFDLVDLTSINPNMHSLTVHIDAQRPRDFQEHVKFGAEYTFMEIISLRAGFEQTVSEEEGVSLGAGLQYGFGGFEVGADYAYTDWGFFGDVQRLGIQIGF